MNVYPAGAEPDMSDEEDDGELGGFIAEQIGHHGWNVNNVMNLFDGLDLVDYEFDIDADDFFDDDFNQEFDNMEKDDREEFVYSLLCDDAIIEVVQRGEIGKASNLLRDEVDSSLDVELDTLKTSQGLLGQTSHQMEEQDTKCKHQSL